MSLASRICAVASEADQGVVEALLADGQVHAAYRGLEPPCIAYDAARFKRLRAADAESLVPFLDAESVRAVFARDARKGVRETLLGFGRVDADGAYDMLAYLSSPDSVWVSEDVWRRLLAAADDDGLARLLAAGFTSGAARVHEEQLRRCTSVDAVLDLVGDLERTPTRLAALLASPSPDVRRWAVESAAGRLDKVLQYADRQGAELVPAMVEHDALADEVVRSHKDRYGRKSVSKQSGSLDALVDALDGPHGARAARILTGCGFARTVVAHATEASVPTFSDATLAGALPDASGRALTVLGREALRRCAEGDRDNETVLTLLEALLPQGDGWTPERVALAHEALDVDTDDRWFACRAAMADPDDPALRERLLGLDLPVRARLCLLDADVPADVVAEVVAAAVAAGDEVAYRKVDELLARVAVPRHLVAGLLDLCAPSTASLEWLAGGSDANPLDDELACDLAARVASPVPLVRHLAGRPAAVAVLLGRAGETPHGMPLELVRLCRLDDGQKRALLAAAGGDAADVLLAGSPTNPLDRAQRALALEAGGAGAYRLVASFAALAPEGDERALLTTELFARCEQELQELGARQDPAAELAETVPLAPEELTALLCGCPRLVEVWLDGRMTKNPPTVEVCELLAAAGLAGPSAAALVALAARAEGSAEVRAWLWDSTEFVAALQAAPRSTSYPDALRLAWELLHGHLGGDARVWEQLAGRLDDWPGSLRALATTCRVAAGAL